jgi:hypothetical protein
MADRLTAVAGIRASSFAGGAAWQAACHGLTEYCWLQLQHIDLFHLNAFRPKLHAK